MSQDVLACSFDLLNKKRSFNRVPKLVLVDTKITSSGVDMFFIEVLK